MAEADSGGDAGGNGDDVLECPAELDADDVGGGVEAKGFGRKLLLDAGGDGGIAEGDGNGGGLGLGDFKGKAGSAECTDGEIEIVKRRRCGRDSRRADLRGGIFGKHFEIGVVIGGDEGVFLTGRDGLAEAGGDDFSHAQEGVVFNAFGGADDDLAGTEPGANASQRGAQEFGRDDGDDDVSLAEDGFAGGDNDFRRDGKAGEKEGVFSGGGDLPGFLHAVRPEGDVVATAAVEREGDGGSPCAGTEDDDTAHAVPFFPLAVSVSCLAVSDFDLDAPKRDS